MSFTVREANTDEAWKRGCAVLHRIYVGEGYTGAERAAAMFTRDQLDREGSLLVALREEGDVVGAVLFLNGDSVLRQVARPGEREFRFLGTDASARGEGVGQSLVGACAERAAAAGATGLVLWTRPSMLAAQRLYERLGFLHVHERDEEDPRGFMRLVYRLALP